MTIAAKENAAPTGIGNRTANTSSHSAHYTTDLASLARAMGGEVVARDSILVPGPGHSDDDRSLSVRLDPNAPDGFIVKSFADDDWRACRDHVKAAFAPLAFAAPAVPLPPVQMPNPDAWKVTWGRGRDPRGTLVELYLRLRGVDLPAEDVRHAPRLWSREEDMWREGMLAQYRNVHTGEVQGIHRTFLFPDGTRGWKGCLGPVKQAAVMFGDTHPGATLAIAEGIETALSVKRMGWLDPVWACVSAGNIDRFPVLPGVRNLVIFADRDGEPNFTGEKVAANCAARWRALGRNVEIRMPKDAGADWNDVLRGRAE